MTIAALSKLRESGEISGILGTLGELTAPKNPSHEEALATALGNGLRSIVVRDDEVASKCIKWLRQNSGGRATFLPLNKLKVSRPQGRTLLVARNPGIIGFAQDLLEYDQEVETAVIYASRNTLLVDSMEVARKNMGGVRMVTLDGSLIESSGAMTGGSTSRGNRPSFGGGTGSSSSLDRHEMIVQEANLLYSTVDAALRETMLNLQSLRDRINNVDGSDHSIKLRNWKSDLDRANKSLSEVEGRMISSRKELRESEENRTRMISLSEKAKEDLEKSLKVRAEAAEALQDNTPDHLSDILRGAERKRTEAERLRLSCESSIATNESQISMMEQRVFDLEVRISKHEGEINSCGSINFQLGVFYLSHQRQN